MFNCPYLIDLGQCNFVVVPCVCVCPAWVKCKTALEDPIDPKSSGIIYDGRFGTHFIRCMILNGSLLGVT